MPTISSYIGPDKGVADRVIVPLDLGDGVNRVDPGSSVRISYGLGGTGFLSAASTDRPIERALAPSLKEQVDTSTTVGDQSFANAWTRSQSDWSAGAGTVTQEPSSDDRVMRSFLKSYGVNVTDTGKLKLSEKLVHWKGWNITPASGISGDQHRPHIASNGDVVLVAQANKYYQLIGAYEPGSSPESLVVVPTASFTATPNMATGVPTSEVERVTNIVVNNNTFFVCTNGSVYSWNGIGAINRRYTFPIGYGSGYSGISYSYPTDKFARVFYAKERLIMCYGGSVWAIPVTDSVVPVTLAHVGGAAGTVPLYHKPPLYGRTVYRGIGTTGTAIYLGCHEVGGDYSLPSEQSDEPCIYKIDLASGSYPPTLNQPSAAASLPRGEYLLEMCSFLGAYLIIGTNLGVRIATISPTNGSVSYGPLLSNAPPPNGPFIVREGFVDYPALNVYTSPFTSYKETGIVSIDMAQVDSDVTAPWSVRYVCELDTGLGSNTEYTAILNGVPAAFSGDTGSGEYGTTLLRASPNSNKLHVMAALNWEPKENSSIFRSSWPNATFSKKYSEGFLVSPKIELNTSEPKYFESITIRLEEPLTGNARIDVQMLDDFGVKFVGTADSSTSGRKKVLQINPVDPSSYASFSFNIYPDTTATTGIHVTPVILSWRVRSLPSVQRQSMFSLNLLCFDQERDSTGVQWGYEGFALDRYDELEAVAASGVPFLFQDFASNSEYRVTCESLSFSQTAPPVQASGFGGIVKIILKTLS